MGPARGQSRTALIVLAVHAKSYNQKNLGNLEAYKQNDHNSIVPNSDHKQFSAKQNHFSDLNSFPDPFPFYLPSIFRQLMPSKGVQRNSETGKLHSPTVSLWRGSTWHRQLSTSFCGCHCCYRTISLANCPWAPEACQQPSEWWWEWVLLQLSIAYIVQLVQDYSLWETLSQRLGLVETVK